MMHLDIKVNIPKLTDYSEKFKRDVGEETLLLIIKSFCRYAASLYCSLIEDEINSSRYKGNWEPVGEVGYKDYIGTEPSYKILDLIEDALEIDKVGYDFVIRINPRYRYPGSKLTLIRVLRAIEEGTSDFNARPILAKCARKMNKNILNLYKGYLTMKGVM